MNKWTDGLPSPLVCGATAACSRSTAPPSPRRSRAWSARGRHATRRASAKALAALKRAAQDGAEPDGAVDRVRPGARDDGRVGRRAARRCSASTGRRRASTGRSWGCEGDRVEALRARIEALVRQAAAGGRASSSASPGLDGHSNGAEVIAVAARHVGFDVVYSGIRLSPEEIVRLGGRGGRRRHRRLGAVGLAPRAGRSRSSRRCESHGAADRIKVVFGGIIPPGDFEALRKIGVRQIFTPADFGLIEIMEKIVDMIEAGG